MKFQWAIQILKFEISRNDIKLDGSSDAVLIDRLQRENLELEEAIVILANQEG